MLRFIPTACVLALALATSTTIVTADDADGFVPLFNGTDLDEWVNVNCGPSTWSVRDGMIVCTGHPAGVLRTRRMYENFVLELDYRHQQEGGNSGVFIWSDAIPAPGQPFTRSIEVQVMDGVETANYTSHGDVFAIHGARMTPDRPHPAGWERCLPIEKRANPSPAWNHYRLVCDRGALKLEVNGKEVSGGHDITPRKGHICLEAEGSEVHFKDLKIKELPSAPDLDANDVALADDGFVKVFNGENLDGWQHDAANDGHWVVDDWVLDYDGKGTHLWSAEEYCDFELIVDWRLSGQPHDSEVPMLGADGLDVTGDDGTPRKVKVKDYGDSGIYLRGNDKSQVNIWCWPAGSGEVYGYRTDTSMPAAVRKGCMPTENADRPPGTWNRFHITMIGDRLTVRLNGKTVIDDAQLPGVPKCGPIALQHHGDVMQFANVYVKRLP